MHEKQYKSRSNTNSKCNFFDRGVLLKKGYKHKADLIVKQAI